MDVNAAAAGCTQAVESQWGPAVPDSCLQGFAFTLLFDESILTILPVAVFLLLAILQGVEVSKRPCCIRPGWLLPAKCLVYTSYIALTAAQIALAATQRLLETPTTLASLILVLVSFCFFLALSLLEHTRSPRPSTLLNCFLALTVLLDLPRLRTLWLISADRAAAGTVLATFCVKVVLLGLEATQKRHLLLPATDKKPAIETTSGILSRLAFAWINPLFAKGFRNILAVNTLMDIDQDLLSSSDPQLLKRRWESTDQQAKYALLRTFSWHYKWTILVGVPPKLAYVGFEFAQPFLIRRVLDFLDGSYQADERYSTAYGLIGAYAIVYIGIAVTYTWTEHKTDRLAVKFRGSLVRMVFEKALSMRASEAADGSALTLMSADVDRVSNGLRLLHDTWSALLEAALALWLLERLLGIAVIAPALFIVLILGLGFPAGNLAGNAQGLWLEAIEKRLAVTSKALGALKGIKMTGAVETIKQIILQLREAEITQSGKYRWYTALTITVAYLADAFTPVLGFGTYILLAQARGTTTLTQGIGFAALTLFQLLDSPMALLIEGVQELKTVVNCFERLQEHLNQPEQADCRELMQRDRQASSSSDTDSEPYTREKQINWSSSKLVVADGLTLKYDGPDEESDSDDDDDEEGEGEKKAPAQASRAIIDAVSFEIPASATTMVVGPVGSGKSTLLTALIGEAQNMAGCLRTAFEHCAYCPQAPWLKYGTIRENIVGCNAWDGAWFDTVVEACNLKIDFADLPEGDSTKVGSRGSRVSGGQAKRIALARALYARTAVLVLDDVLTGLDRRTEQAILDNVFSSHGLLRAVGASTILATNSANQLQYADYIIQLTPDGGIGAAGTYQDVLKSSDFLQTLSQQPPASVAHAAPQKKKTDEDPRAEANEEVEQAMMEAENEARRTGDLRIYAYYFSNAGWGLISLFLAAACVFVFGITFPTVWVQWWTLANDEHGTHRVGYWLGVYAALGAISVAATFGSSFVLLMLITPTAARNLHRKMLDVATNAGLGWLTSTDTGTTTNRFAQDLELVDLDLPTVFETTVISALACVAEAVLVFTGSGYVAAALPGVFVVVYLIQNFYLRTSRQLRLLDIESRAPLFSSFLELLTGLESIRAFDWGSEYLRTNRAVLDASQKPFYLLYTVQRWLTLVLQLVVAGVAILLVALATTTEGSYTYLLGAALFNIVSFGSTLEQVVTDWVQLEQSIGAVARIRSFVRSTPQESESDGADFADDEWPKLGDISFQGVGASYDESQERVLQDLTFDIKDGENVAICGRTGSGKSSLISALLRLLDLNAGSITISGRDIGFVPRSVIRERINTIPQEPHFFHGSLRLNADPQGISSDSAIVAALEAVGLWKIWSEHGSGLDAAFDENLLSQGQRQLFCLARALCKPGQILILDEITSSVDAETDALMQQVLDRHFKAQTVIAIAHKLQAVVEYDKVAVLSRGALLEFGRPRELLQRQGSAFRELYEATGSQMTADAPPGHDT